MSQTLVLPVEGMTCEHCVARVTKALKGVGGVVDVEVELPGEARVVVDGASREDLVRAIEDVGYDVPKDAAGPDEEGADGAGEAAGPHREEPLHPVAASGLAGGGAEPVAASGLAGGAGAVLEKVPDVPLILRQSVPVLGMHCASCVSTVERALADVPGVESAYVNLAAQRATVTTRGPVDVAAIRHAIADAGYESPEVRAGEHALDVEARARAEEIGDLGRRLAVSAPLAAVVVAIAMLPMVGVDVLPHAWAGWAELALTSVVMAVGGSRYVRGFVQSVRNRVADMSTLVTLGTGAAFLWSAVALVAPLPREGMHPPLYFESAAAIIALVLFGNWLEARAKGRASTAIRALLDLQPKRARVVRGDQDVDVDVADVVPGDVLRVRPGERVPVDGVVREGRSNLDEAMVTGESMPVARGPGDVVLGGTVNQDGALLVEATRIGEDSAVGRIVRLVEEAQTRRAPIQRLADRVAAVFVPAVLAIAAVTFVAWIGFAPASMALVRMVSVLIVACPCALGIATPIAVLVGTGRAAQKGVLFRDAGSLEAAQKLDVVVLDKTGTVTEGRPSVVAVHAVDGDADALLAVAAAVEKASEHPLAKAIVAAAPAGSAASAYVATEVQARPGRGLTARVGGRRVVVGNRKALEDEGVAVAPVADLAAREEALARTVVLVAWDGRVRGVVAVADRVKATSKAAVASLRALGLDVVLLTGDGQAVADAIAREVGIDRVVAGVLPEGKVDVVAGLQAEGKRVAMVGDGVNDAPALAKADVGIAMGSGTDVALETATVALLRDDLRAVADAIALSKRTVRTIRQNLFFAFVYNTLGIPLAAGVLAGFGLVLSPMFAAAAMAMSSVSVVTNSLRLSRA